MIKLTILSPDDKLTEIRRLYFSATKQTIGEDLARAVQLLKSMNTEEERERATVYMDGLAQMRSDWAREGRAQGTPPARLSGRSAKQKAAGETGGKASSNARRSGAAGDRGGSGRPPDGTRGHGAGPHGGTGRGPRPKGPRR